MSRRNFRPRGVRTHACSVHTCVSAESRVSTRPAILDSPDQIRLERIPFNIASNPVPLIAIPHPVIVGFPLPERLAGPIQDSICLPRCRSPHRFHELRGADDRQKKRVDVIRHDGERLEFVVARLDAAKQRIDHDFPDGLLREKHRAAATRVELSVFPGKGFAGCGLGRRTEAPRWHASVKDPCDEQPAAFWMDVGQASARIHKPNSAVVARILARSHECERGTQECVRHK